MHTYNHIHIADRQVLPGHPLPVCIIGAGGVVKDAHLPAYRKAGFVVHSLTDVQIEKAERLADVYDVAHVFGSVEEAVANAPENTVFDIALVPGQFIPVLKQLPDRSAVLLQKPMGRDFKEAEKIHSICKQKQLKAATNFQLRYAPFVKAARSIIDAGRIGELYDMEIRLTTYTPWEIFPGVMNEQRLEMLYHSIHYIDLIRSFLGDPRSVLCRTLRHPEKVLSSTRSTILFDYGVTLRAVINTNHDHDFGKDHQESFIKWEGTKGAIKAGMGLLLNYPDGVSDRFEYCIPEKGKEPAWIEHKLEGSWFPDAFIGTMSALMRYATGETDTLPTHVDNSLRTMAVLESAYRSHLQGGVHIQDLPAPHF